MLVVNPTIPRKSGQYDPVIPRSDLLEDEIMEGRFSSTSSQSPSQPSKDQPELRSSSQVRASTPAFSLESTTNPPSVELMTKEHLDRAKSLVLDLLGWDVTLEYLVERGLSSAAIYAIFTDLRLRLPSNTNTLSPLPSHHERLDIRLQTPKMLLAVSLSIEISVTDSPVSPAVCLYRDCIASGTLPGTSRR
ncbi:hypothetical protein L210DRAFT_987708 [Boletus edulis BED1]|uniref:Uncharacterized protein n=1 Tax=Boletus edulis BED1 TaxID=1328754 RepID=A0AAD4G6E8_BOLED|nr:hypothetical protein L210DRAFT_987708 [Boletus edulis BED1]